MKLIRLPKWEIESIEVTQMRSPSFFDAWRTDAEKIARRKCGPTTVFAGRHTLTENAVIQDDDEILVVGEKIESLLFDDCELLGVIPVVHMEGKFYCTVDYMKVLK